jgi:hypothetical protein
VLYFCRMVKISEPPENNARQALAAIRGHLLASVY